VCVPYDGEVTASDKIRARIEASHEEAFTTITKAQVAFPGILEAYEAVEKWIADNNLTMDGSPREVYFADWAQIEDDDPGCDIAFPIKS
jgi:effector-binding domain-containing protein